MLLRHAVLAAAEPGEEAVIHSQPPSAPSLPAHLTLRGTVLKQMGQSQADWVWDYYDSLGCSSFSDPHVSTSNSCRAELEALAFPCLTRTYI